MKRILTILTAVALVVVLSSCGNISQKDTSSNDDTSSVNINSDLSSVTKITADEFAETITNGDSSEYTGKIYEITGKVDTYYKNLHKLNLSTNIEKNEYSTVSIEIKLSEENTFEDIENEATITVKAEFKNYSKYTGIQMINGIITNVEPPVEESNIESSENSNSEIDTKTESFEFSENKESSENYQESVDESSIIIESSVEPSIVESSIEPSVEISVTPEPTPKTFTFILIRSDLYRRVRYVAEFFHGQGKRHQR